MAKRDAGADTLNDAAPSAAPVGGTIWVRNMMDQKLEYSVGQERHVFLPYERQAVSGEYFAGLPAGYFTEVKEGL